MKKTLTLGVVLISIGMVFGQDHPGDLPTSKSNQLIKHRLDSTIVFEWNEDISDWEKYMKEEHIYSEMHQLTFEHYWDEDNNQWETDGGQEFLFNSNGDIIEMSDYQEVQTEKFVFYYDNDGVLEYGIGYERDNGDSDWFAVDSTSYTFNEDVKVIRETDYVWSETTNNWINDDKCEYLYNDDGYLESETEYWWDNGNSEWVYDELDSKEYFYDDDGHLIFRKEYDPPETMKCNYDTDGNIVQELFGDWNPLTDEGLEEEANTKWELTYDLSVGSDELILPFSEDNEPVSDPLFIELVNDLSLRQIFNNKPLEMVYFERDDQDEWESTIKAVCYYSEQNISHIGDEQTGALKIYPNPASDFIQVESNNDFEPICIQIYDTQGRILLNSISEGNQKVNVSELGKGIYIYKIRSGSEFKTGKLIKK